MALLDDGKPSHDSHNRTNTHPPVSSIDEEAMQRIARLEAIVSRQEIEIRRLRRECDALAEAATAFDKLQHLLREAGLDRQSSKGRREAEEPKAGEGNGKASGTEGNRPVYEYFDDSEIFGTAPSSVIDAADAAGAAILAALLGGKQRMLVDVRDAELSRDPETLVQFIELAILPVAAGLEGMPKNQARRRVKIVFPTVSQLLQYRSTMALAAPEVVALSTLGFDPVEKEDSLVVLIAPSPDDEDGLEKMNELLAPTSEMTKPLNQPVVVLNHHMVPVTGPAANFEVAYHLRLLSVQFMSGDDASEYLKDLEDSTTGDKQATENSTKKAADPSEEDAALEAAMKHAHEIGMNQGVTRAMVIRAYPK
jgi:uncharacterized coiled-coil protein SlyX